MNSQLQVRQQAQQNRQQFYSANRGRPAMTAAARPIQADRGVQRPVARPMPVTPATGSAGGAAGQRPGQPGQAQSSPGRRSFNRARPAAERQDPAAGNSGHAQRSLHSPDSFSRLPSRPRRSSPRGPRHAQMQPRPVPQQAPRPAPQMQPRPAPQQAPAARAPDAAATHAHSRRLGPAPRCSNEASAPQQGSRPVLSAGSTARWRSGQLPEEAASEAGLFGKDSAVGRTG